MTRKEAIEVLSRLHDEHFNALEILQELSSEKFDTKTELDLRVEALEVALAHLTQAQVVADKEAKEAKQ